MESDNGRLNIAYGIDDSQGKQKAEEIKKDLQGIGKTAEEAGRTSDDAFRKMSESASASVRKMSDSIQESQNAAKDAVKGAVSASEKEMERLKEAFQNGYNFDGPVSELKKRIKTVKDYIKELEDQYKQARDAQKNAAPGDEWLKLDKKLAALTPNIKEQKQELAGLKQKYDELSSNTFTSLRTQIMNITNQMAQMRLEGKQGTEEYKNLEKELGKLASVQREIQQGKLFDSTSGTQIQGIMQGVQALMGAYTAFNGIASIFVEDEQQLMKIQTRLQSTMSILMGLNSVATALHHTSALRLRTLAALQNMWTAATRATTVAMSGLKKAIVSTGIGALVVVVGMLISKLTELNKRSKESRERMNALKKAHAETAGEVAKHVSQIDAYTNALKKGNLSKREEWDIIKKLNSQYGNLFGKYYTKAEWLKKLTDKTKEYTEALVAQKTAEQAASRIVENTAKRDEAEQQISEYKNKKPKYLAEVRKANIEKIKANPKTEETQKQAEELASAQGISYEKALDIVVETYNKNAERILNAAEASLQDDRKYRKLVKERDRLQGLIDKDTKTLNDATVKGLKTTGLGGDAQDEAKQADDLAKLRQDGWNKVYNAEISAMVEGYTRSKEQLEEQHRQTMQQIDRDEKDLAQKLKEQGQGGLSDDDRNRFEGLRNAETDKYLKDKKQLEEQHQKELQSLYKQTSEAFMTTQQNEIKAIKDKYAEMRSQLDKQKEGGAISSELHVALMGNVDKSEATEMANYWLEAYGNYDQKRRALDEQWRTDLKDVPPEFAGEAQRQMTEALSKLDFEQFKKTIDWSGIFGDLGNQSTQALQYNLQQVQAYFDSNKLNLGIDEIKDIQEAIKSMTDELEGRNPFAGLLKSLKGLGAAKAEAVSAMDEIRQANAELNAAKAEERLAEAEFLEYSAMVEAADDPEAMEAKIAAEERLAAAKTGVATAEDKKAKADQKGVKASNSMAAATKKFTSNLKSTKGVISGIANDAKDLAGVFSDDVADGIGKAMDLFDTVIDSATNVIDTIANTGKQVGESITSTVQASSTAMQATSMAAATSIQTVEKASVILTVISAALQVATAIASLFGNGDDKRQKEIEALQGRIDQLQWELDNAAIVRLQGVDGEDTAGSVVEEIKKKYVDAADEIGKAWQDTVGSYLDNTKVIWSMKEFEKGLKKASDAFNKKQVDTVAKGLVKDFSNIKYSADKVFGDAYWNKAANNAENYAKQMVLMEQQLEAEKGKKKKDNDKIKEYEQGIAELKQKINDEFNGVLEEIIGGSAQDIAEQLGDAFFEAFEAGEDAAEAWGQAVDKIVADVIKKMFIQQFLTQNIADIFDKYKEKWFSNGKFIGWDAFQETVGEFGSDLKEAAGFAVEAFEHMPDDIKELFTSSAREASEKGIASISQDSADEMNGRLTAIQSHTYAINENVKLIVSISNSILISVLDIQENTERINAYLAGLAGETRQLRASVESIQNRGLQLR